MLTLVFVKLRPGVWSAAPLFTLGFDFGTEQIRYSHRLTRLGQLVNEALETFGKKIVPQVPVMVQTGRGEIMPVEIPPAAPDLLIHQTINKMKVDCFHCL